MFNYLLYLWRTLNKGELSFLQEPLEILKVYRVPEFFCTA